MLRIWLACGLCALALGLPARADPGTAIIDGRTLTLQHGQMLMDGHLMTPVNEIFGLLGGTFSLDSDGRTAIGVRGTHTLQLTIGSPVARIDGLSYSMGAPAVKLGGIVLVPSSFASQACGSQIAWVPPVFGSAASVVAPTRAIIPAGRLAITALSPEEWDEVGDRFDLEGQTAAYATVKVSLSRAADGTFASSSAAFLNNNRPREFAGTADPYGHFSLRVDARHLPKDVPLKLRLRAQDGADLGPERTLDLMLR